MNTVSDSSHNLNRTDIAPLIGEQLATAYDVMNIPGNYGAFYDVNRLWAGRLFDVVALGLPNSSKPAMFEHCYEATPWQDKAQQWVDQARMRRLRAKIYGSDPNYSEIRIEEYRPARDENDIIIPMKRVQNFTATLIHLPDKSGALGIFKNIMKTNRRGRVTAHNIFTSELFDKATGEPLVAIFEVGTDSTLKTK